ncbi:hypothetical protein Tco_0761690 [Tanacetum coccineum]
MEEILNKTRIRFKELQASTDAELRKQEALIQLSTIINTNNIIKELTSYFSSVSPTNNIPSFSHDIKQVEQVANKDDEYYDDWDIGLKEYEKMFAEAVIVIDDRLVKLIDITLEQWLDLKFGDHKNVDKEIMEEVVNTWLIRCYRKQFEECMEIKRRLKVNEIITDVECDPTNVEFSKWLASKFNNHKTMDRYIKNALWLYWKRGDDEVILTYDEFSDLAEENLSEENEINEIFRM